MANTAIRFGRADHLIGVIHEPVGVVQPFGVLLWNTGISPRTGPFRVHFEIAEMLQKQGFPVLRFDLAKLGDSDEAENDLAIQDIFTRDIGDAVKLLEQRFNLQKFVLLGICSGAVDAWYYAREDSRVLGLCMIDTFVYPTFRHRLQSLLVRASNPRRWWRYFQQLPKRLISRKYLPIANDYLDANYPVQVEAERATQSIIDRGTNLFVLFTGGFQIWYSYKEQFRQMLPSVNFKDQLQIHSWPKVDHLFSLLEDRKQLLAHLQTWFEQCFITIPVREISSAPVSAAQFISEEPSLDIILTPALESEAHVQMQEHLQGTILECFRQILYPAQLETDDSFFDFGGNSILAIKCVQRLAEKLEQDVPIVFLYTYPQAKNFALALAKENASKPLPSLAIPVPAPQSSSQTAPVSQQAIAIIGMSCKVPGARNIGEFWELVAEGREGITRFRPEELDPSLPLSMVQHPNYVAARGIIDGDRFDHEFFAINRREAMLLDPQQRVLMETCWQALEDAGWAHRRQDARIGVYVGVGSSGYLTRNIMQGHATPHSEEEYMAVLANDKDYVATRIAYQLDLRGPAVSVHTACSTSLVAVIEAVKTLLTDDADIVIAGAAAINSPIASGHLYQEGAIFSQDGHCRPFAANATGTVFSDGSAVVVLKRLDRAIADGDPIHAVLQGWGLNNDGRDKSSFAAPSVNGQAAAIRKAYERAGWSPRTVGYIECHGTATPIGDPIEIEGLRQVFQTSTADASFCALGSVKANIGHLTAAAGTIGLIKAVLAITKAIIPPAMHAKNLNPELRLTRSPFFVPTEARVWQGLGPRRAGISSFGVGGTNAHVLIEEAPARNEISAALNPEDPWMTLTWSAKDPMAALRLAHDLAHSLGQNQIKLPDLSYTLRYKRPRFGYRISVSASNHEQLLQKLFKLSRVPQLQAEQNKPIVLMFPGQGSQYPKMGQDLARVWPRFAAHYSKVVQDFEQNYDLKLSSALNGLEVDGELLLNSTQFTQPAVFALEWALAKSLLDAGLPIVGLLGHSIGEITAACIAEVMSLKDAVHLVYHRARIMQSAALGGMLAVRTSAQKIKPMLIPGIEICVINTPENCVIGGDLRSLDTLMPILKAKGIAFKQLETSHAFHSSMMDSALDEFRLAIRDISLSASRWPLISTVDGEILSSERVRSVEYWVQQIRQPVRFLEAVQQSSRMQEAMFLEVGPRDSLTRFVKQILHDDERWPVLALLPKTIGTAGEEGVFAEALDHLANAGLDLFVPKQAWVTTAPVYSFLGEKLWLTPLELNNPITNNSFQSAPAVSSKTVDPLAGGVSTWLSRLSDRLGQLAGLNAHQLRPDLAWTALGLDSLLLTQWALKLQKEWRIDMNIQMLQNEIPDLRTLAEHMQHLQPLTSPIETPPQLPIKPFVAQPSPIQTTLPSSMDTSTLQALFNQQLVLMHRQLEILQNLSPASTAAAPAPIPASTAPQSKPRTAELSIATIHSDLAAAKPIPQDIPFVAKPAAPPVQAPTQAQPSLPSFLNQLVHEGEIEFANDDGIQRLPRYRGSFLATGEDGKPGLFIENPDQIGEYWQVIGG